MEVTWGQRIGFIIMWIAIVPISTYSLFQFDRPDEVNWGILLAYVALALLASILPFKVAGTTIMLIQWVNLAVFLQYGILVEMIVMQIAIIPLFFYLKLFSKDEFYRMFFNSLMFFSVSVVSGLAVYSLGFDRENAQIGSILLYSVIFQLVNMFANHLFLFGYLKYFKDPDAKFMSIDTLWDYAGMVITLPFGIMLYLLNLHVGVIGFLLLGIPFVMISLVVRMYNSSEKINDDLNVASEIGQQLAGKHTVDEIFNIFLQRVNELFPTEFSYIVDIRRKSDEMYVMFAYVNGQEAKPIVSSKDLVNSIPGRVWKKDKSYLYHTRSEWNHIPLTYLPDNVESIMAVPISRNQRIEGVFLLASTKKFAFETHQLQILQLLCSYFAVSLEKAKYVEDAVSKSERCGLTKLYNYRYFDHCLELEMNKLLNGKLRQLSLMMLDIDHFKMINDTYGHQSGNEILVAFSRLLERELGELGTLARYGGEEFVVLLPNMSKQKTLELAERLRKVIEETPFAINMGLADRPQIQEVTITASIGISTAPEDSDEGMSLIRNADRALYIGAKREGRNRVAEYIK
ncbi:sensor domain-containing diguanylate cyclase [Paenisporosarcina cavernae]|uniref:GGDEF domain-containing protein n=1 Tax=Paenisporosarcina cavernae TaxID=2320858 RepID=A0A385YW80_9BACL|nr:sensor domain-containing diguanylate cyclase [Paenisporosarcina cavernae]AYC29762.1 GGDEF domain-containing protein [Paenisporosarcina cavernae]